MLLSSQEKSSITLTVPIQGKDLGPQSNLSLTLIIKSVRVKYVLYLKEISKAPNSFIEILHQDLSICKLKLSMVSNWRPQQFNNVITTYKKNKGKARYLELLFSLVNTQLLPNLLEATNGP